MRSEHETVCLIDLWGEGSVQFQIEGCARNREVYEKLAEQMRDTHERACSVGTRSRSSVLMLARKNAGSLSSNHDQRKHSASVSQQVPTRDMPTTRAGSLSLNAV